MQIDEAWKSFLENRRPGDPSLKDHPQFELALQAVFYGGYMAGFDHCMTTLGEAQMLAADKFAKVITPGKPTKPH